MNRLIRSACRGDDATRAFSFTGKNINPMTKQVGATPTDRILISVLLLLVLFVPRIYAQEPNRVLSLPDSSRRVSIEIDLQYMSSLSALSFPPSLKARLGIFSDLRHRSLMNLSPSLGLYPPLQPDLSIQTMWQNALRSDQEYQTLWTILGSIEMGGVAYIAYRHIKKYGLW
jgi:hypothetical protein